MSLAGSVIAVSGAASGIGLATAQLLGRRGARLALADRDGAAVEAEAGRLRAAGAQCVATRADIRSAADVDAWIRAAVEAFGRLDGAVNCAGVLRPADKGRAPLTDHSDADWAFVVDTNLGGVFRSMRAQLAAVADGGSIVNLTSTAGVQGLPHDAPYCASKHAIIGLTRSAAKEVAARGIRVNCVAPATIDTPMLQLGHGPARELIEAEIRGHTPMRRFGTAEEVAQTIAFLLGPESRFTTGTVTAVDGGMTA